MVSVSARSARSARSQSSSMDVGPRGRSILSRGGYRSQSPGGSWKTMAGQPGAVGVSGRGMSPRQEAQLRKGKGAEAEGRRSGWLILPRAQTSVAKKAPEPPLRRPAMQQHALLTNRGLWKPSSCLWCKRARHSVVGPNVAWAGAGLGYCDSWARLAEWPSAPNSAPKGDFGLESNGGAR